MPTTANIHTERVFEDELCANLEASGWAIKTHPENAPSYNRELIIKHPRCLSAIGANCRAWPLYRIKVSACVSAKGA